MHPKLSKISPFKISFLLLIMVCISLESRASNSSIKTENAHLKRVVILLRHGIRAPTKSLKDYSLSPWPTWPVGNGMLTPRGFQLAEGLGRYLLSLYSKFFDLNLLKCQALDLKYSRADNFQRTKATAHALLRGMFPTCNLTLPSSPEGTYDPYFSPLLANVCAQNNHTARRTLKTRIGHSKNLLDRFKNQIFLVQLITNCCNSNLCEEHVQPCTLMNLREELDQRDKISGPFQKTQEIIETFILEKAEGFSDQNWGWGKINDPILTFLAPLHTYYHDLVNRTPYLARIKGSNLAALIFASIQEATLEENIPPFVLIVGHDTNVDHIGALFGLNWKPQTYAKNQVPPGSGLIFELYYHPSTKTYTVKTYFITQTLEQMAHLQLASEDSPPEWVLLQIDFFRNYLFK